LQKFASLFKEIKAICRRCRQNLASLTHSEQGEEQPAAEEPQPTAEGPQPAAEEPQPIAAEEMQQPKQEQVSAYHKM